MAWQTWDRSLSLSLLSRRHVVFGPIALSAIGSVPALAAGTLPLPVGMMNLSRRVERELSDGAMITVERTWNVQFARQGSGAAITGQQSFAKVSAPPQLARLAEIEQARSTNDMFPFLLSENGMLVAAGKGLQKQDLEAAAQEAERTVRARKLAAGQREEQLRYLALLQRSAGKLIDKLPEDLFFPAVPRVHMVEPVRLGDGQTGEFELIYETACAPQKPWLATAERRVITRLGSTQQQSREVWKLHPA